MALGALSTLGLGSSGILTNDIIDQLKEADKASLVDPIESRKDKVISKQDALTDLKPLLDSLSTAVTDMTYEKPYSSLKTDISGDSISISTTSGVKSRDFDIDVTNIATKDIYQSLNGFSNKSSTLESGVFEISIGDDSFSIDIEDGDTLEDLVENINSSTSSKVEASILNIGGDDPYKLIVKSADTGVDNRITLSSSSNSFSSGLDRIGDPAQDAIFKLDGIEITRSSNEIDDLIDNMTITLKDSGESRVKLEQDNTKLIEGIEEFVEKFNEAVLKLDELTKYDSEAKTSGVFQGNADIRDISRGFKDVVSTTVSKDSKMFTEFGLEMQRDGTLKLDLDELKTSLSDDMDEAVEFFKASNATDGLFNKLESKIFDLVTSSDGPIKSLKTHFDDSIKRLDKEYSTAQTRLDSRYDALIEQFAAYDAVMGKMSRQSDTLSQMIEAQFADNS
jgi:flagellar hook-associated protein 2